MLLRRPLAPRRRPEVYMLLLLLMACHRPPAPALAAPSPSLAPTLAEPAPLVLAEPIAPAAAVDTGEAVATVVRGNSGALRACYEHELKVDPAVRGRVEAEWRLDAGRAVDVTVLENTTGKTALGLCVAEAVSSWRFPAGLDDTVVWPFLFLPRT